MSLLRLLTTGKSLVGGNDTETRYRLTRQRLLPQFGPATNPFKNSGKSEPGRTEASSPGRHHGSDTSGDKDDSSVSGGTPSVAVQAVVEHRKMSAAARAHPLAAALRSRAAALLSRWRAKLSRLPRRASGKAAKPAIPPFTKPPVQAELSLDKIKVVRNDLSDADLEVVPTKQPAIPTGGAPDMGTEERAGVQQGTSRRIPARMPGSGKT